MLNDFLRTWAWRANGVSHRRRDSITGTQHAAIQQQ